MAAPNIRLTRRDAVACITIDRPEVRNALAPSDSAALSEAFDAVEADQNVRVAILTGAGDKSFCAGGDLKAREPGSAAPATGFGGLTKRFDRSKPVIAAVNGDAFGGGFELALACDLILAADHARFALPEPERGIIAGGGGLHRLPRSVGEKRALALILSAEPVSAAEGLRLGFVNEVLPPDTLMTRAWQLADRIASLAPLAVAASLDCVRKGLDAASLEEAILGQPDWASVRAVRISDDRREGIEAFREKRPPSWRGR